MMRCVRGAAGLAAMATLLAIAQQAPPGSPGDPYQLPQANRLPDKNQQMQTNQRQVKPAGYEAANTEGTKQIADDAAKLLELAKELKAAVDKTDKDMLSVNVIRKAESIEKLAKGVKEKMKQTVGES
jgi:hypothetical protein